MEPPRLLVNPPDAPEMQYVLYLGEVVIGRDEACTVVLGRKGVSRRHARLRFEEGRATLEDLGSTNGTRLNGKRIGKGPQPLGPGDCIEIGRVELRYVPPFEEKAAPPDDATQTQLQTVLEQGQLTALMARDPTLLDTPEAEAGLLTVVAAKTTGPLLRVRQEDMTHEVPLGGGIDELLIGRGPECRIRLDDRRASTQHASIRFADGRFLLRDLDSRNGTHVNGIAVTEHELVDYDVVRIGEATLIFVGGEPSPESGAVAKPDRPRPVVLISGFGGTELWNGERKIWPLTLGALTTDEKQMHRHWNGAEPRGIIRERVVLPGLVKLDRFGALSRYLLGELGYDLRKDILEFGYDWRRSNVHTAQDLATAVQGWRARRQSPTERITIIAHSMGGLVTRLCLAQSALKDAVERVLFLGTPHLGSPQSLHHLVAGEAPFSPLNRARRLVQRFTSFYQLLPAFPCAELENGSLFLPFETAPDWLPATSRADMEEAVRVRQLLDAHRRLPVPATCIFGFDQKTLERIVVRRERDGSILEVSSMSTPCGDGVVPEMSTVLEGTEVHPVRQQHGALFSDRDVQRRLRYELVERPPATA